VLTDCQFNTGVVGTQTGEWINTNSPMTFVSEQLPQSERVFKTLPRQFKDDGDRASLTFLSNEMIYDGGWGDDNSIRMLNDLFLDTNGNACKSTIQRLAKPYGWIKNEH